MIIALEIIRAEVIYSFKAFGIYKTKIASSLFPERLYEL